ncbi:halocyanin domain-containing protein [Haloplanus vescus]|uniref:Halocyanin domain-containing protein n=1 Tax=Haloplanus vescus TaxID=555874 RepID=A0A1H3VMF5_9EURY|nr:halocyanin domain-containing protein [Haloplanus vescus]SDZ75929.1 halocyanin domain-containing protein [Haloplanus vescus]
MSEERDARLGRRGLLRAGAGTVGAGLVGAGVTGTAAAQSGPFGGWMSDVGNYDGVHDMTGSGEVTVDVGVQANGAAYGFGPAAIQVDPGTTVVWEWTGNGGVHNVAAESGGDYSSELVQEEGHTFSHTFESGGVSKYYCQPHQSLGMKGVVVVGDNVPSGAEVVSGGGGGGGSGGSGGSGGEGGSGGGGSGMDQNGFNMSLMIGGSLVAAFLSPIVFGLILMLRDAGGRPPEDGASHGGHSHED